MLKIVRTDATHQHFIDLVRLLDKDLALRDGDDHTFYDQFNKIDTIKYALVAYQETEPIGCGAIKEFLPDVMEVKRMYLLPMYRGKGIAQKIVSALEQWAKELGYAKCVLETGKKQPEAIALYKKCGYQITANYGQYLGIDNSVCFEKVLS